MKKVTKALLSLAFIFAILPTGVLLANNEDISLADNSTSNIDQEIDEMFECFDSSKKVVHMPRGGFLQGYDTETNENAITIEEAKKIEKAERLAMEKGYSVSLFGTNLPTEPYPLKTGQVYKSNSFSGSGWRLSGYKFKPEVGHGNRLYYTSKGDSANAGSLDDAKATINGGINSGTPLALNQPTPVISYGYTCYYTWNPIKGSYYVVQNI